MSILTTRPPIEIDMRSYASDIDARLHDIRDLQAEVPAIYHPDPANYGPAQVFAKSLRATGSNGIVYSSVRAPGGKCVAVFRPAVLEPVLQGKHYCYVWDGSQMVNVYVKTKFLQ